MKCSYREYFANVSQYLKMNKFLKMAKIPCGTFSYFMKGPEYDMLISVEKLEFLKSCIIETCSKFG